MSLEEDKKYKGKERNKVEWKTGKGITGGREGAEDGVREKDRIRIRRIMRWREGQKRATKEYIVDLERRDCDLFRHLLEGTSENQEEVQSGLRPCRVSIQAPPEHKYRSSPPDQPLRCQSFKAEQCNRDYSS